MILRERGEEEEEFQRKRSNPDIPGVAWFAVLFAVGTVTMRAAGCVVNDLLDRDFDRQTPRGQVRPLADGSITVRAALILLGVLCLIGLAVLSRFNLLTMIIALGATPFIALYPLAKRVMGAPQFILGALFNTGALLGWTALTGALDLAPFLLYAGMIVWTLCYDTIYAFQDYKADRALGLGSLAVTLGPAKARFYLPVLAGLGWVGLVLAPIHAHGRMIPDAAVLVALAPAGWLALRTVLHVDLTDERSCLAAFRRFREITALVVVGYLALLLL